MAKEELKINNLDDVTGGATYAFTASVSLTISHIYRKRNSFQEGAMILLFGKDANNGDTVTFMRLTRATEGYPWHDGDTATVSVMQFIIDYVETDETQKAF